MISTAGLERVLSPERFGAYREAADGSEIGGLACYLWNLGLANALQYPLNVLEVGLRNEINRAAVKLIQKDGRQFAHRRIPSWLDADPPMLMASEQEKVERAKKILGTDPHSQTEGHLIAKLDFGFWVALCRHSYADTTSEGPRLWPRALDLAFRTRPAGVTTESQIYHRFDPIRLYRNRVAHHEPIWDHDYLKQHAYIIESVSWMSPRMADVLDRFSQAPNVYNAGHHPYIPWAKAILGAESGSALLNPHTVLTLPEEQCAAVGSLVHALLRAPESTACADAVHTWASTFPDEGDEGTRAN